MIFDKIRAVVGAKFKNKAPQPKSQGNPLPEDKLETGRLIGQAAKKDAQTIKAWKQVLTAAGLKTTDRILEIAQMDLMGQQQPQPQQAPAQQPKQLPKPPQQAVEEQVSMLSLINTITNMQMDHSKIVQQLCQERIAESIALKNKYAPIPTQPPPAG